MKIGGCFFMILAVALLISAAGCSPEKTALSPSTTDMGGAAEDQKEQQIRPAQERNFVALGDSFTKANNPSSQKTGDHEEYSFSTGTEIESVYLHLKNTGENLKAVNLAESGAASRDILEKQVPNALSLNPKHITLLTGGPDILTGVTVEQYKQNLLSIVAQIRREGTVILIATNPDIPKMRTASFPSCSTDKLGLNVKALTEEKIRSFNQAVREIAEQNNLLLVDLYGVLGPDDVSDYDCLHPNMRGQQKVAQEFINALK